MSVTKQAEPPPRLVVVKTSPTSDLSTGRPFGLLCVVSLISLWFIYTFALPYVTSDIERLGIYKSRYEWLYVHIVGGAAALLLGPVQLWLGPSRRSIVLHRVLGVGYVLSVGTSSTAAFYLAWKTDFGWVFGLGFASMALAWTMTTALAVAAIARRLIQQHREWMIRSCVVTFGFVLFRIITGIFETARIGTTVEQVTAASWLCWSVPLVITESILQGRKIISR